MKTNELTGAALDWAVAKCESLDCYIEDGLVHLRGQPFDTDWRYWLPSTEWAQGGPIIEQNAIHLTPDEYLGVWSAYMTNEGESYEGTGPNPLAAAMRCYVASKLGDTIDIPEELTGETA